MQATKQDNRPVKLASAPMVADVGVPSPGRRLCVYDLDTRERFLVDTGADISVLAVSNNKQRRKRSAYTLYAANDTPINTYGEKTLKLNLGLMRCFKWTFIVADVKSSILGADFLQHYKLLVDLHNRKLIDKVTELSINALKVSERLDTSIHFVNSEQSYNEILKKYPDVLRPTPLKPAAGRTVQLPVRFA